MSNRRKRKVNRRQLVILLALLVVLACSVQFFYQYHDAKKHLQATFTGSEQILKLKIAATDAERAQGLMYVKELPADQGMIFIFPKFEVNKFWMKNTPLPLDIIFLNSQRRVIAIAEDTRPFSEKKVGPDKRSKFVVELNAGQAAAYGIKPGAKLESKFFSKGK